MPPPSSATVKISNMALSAITQVATAKYPPRSRNKRYVMGYAMIAQASTAKGMATKGLIPLIAK